MEGTVKISIKDFDELREISRRYDLLRKSLHRCTKFEVKEIEEGSDQWIQVIEVDAIKVGRIAAEHSDVEEVYEEDIIKLINMN